MIKLNLLLMALIGIDFGATHIKAGLVKNNELLDVIFVDTEKDSSQENILNKIYDLIDQLFGNDIESIGIGVPGIINVEEGIVLELGNIPSWKNVPLKKLLEEKFKVPVYLTNDANCFVLGEKYFGIAKNYKNIIGLTLGTGLGGGIILNNKLYSGQNCSAGEFCEFPYNNTYIGDWTSSNFFIKHKTTGYDAYINAKKGNKKYLKLFDEFAFHLGYLISVIISSFAPELIVIGGSISKSHEFFEESMFDFIKKSLPEVLVNNTKIEFSTIDNVAILGAASLHYNYSE